MIVSNIELHPKKRDALKLERDITCYMQEKYLSLMVSIAEQANTQHAIVENFGEMISLRLKCKSELGYA